MPEHLTGHLLTMGELHRAGRYDRRADGIQRLTGRAAMSVRELCRFMGRSAADAGSYRPTTPGERLQAFSVIPSEWCVIIGAFWPPG